MHLQNVIDATCMHLFIQSHIQCIQYIFCVTATMALNPQPLLCNARLTIWVTRTRMPYLQNMYTSPESNKLRQVSWFQRKKKQLGFKYLPLADGRGTSRETAVVFRSLENETSCPQKQGDSICPNTSPGLSSSSFSSLLLNSPICAVFGQRRKTEVVMNELSSFRGKLPAGCMNTQHAYRLHSLMCFF